MPNKIRLAGHTSVINTARVYKISKHLFEISNITYFCYLRRYKSGRFTFLPSMIDLGRYFFEDGVYPHTWFAGLDFAALKTGYSFWDLSKQVSEAKTIDIGHTIANDFNLTVGIDITEKYADYCDFYCFAGHSADIYFLPMTFLYRFIYYFKQECLGLLQQAYEDRLHLGNASASLPPVPILAMNSEPSLLEDSFDVKRYYLDGDYQGIFLTKREVDILRKMEAGETVKCLADSLCISPRTLEHHISNIKEKLSVSRASELIHLARQHKIIT